jgi:hypothetical protein
MRRHLSTKHGIFLRARFTKKSNEKILEAIQMAWIAERD